MKRLLLFTAVALCSLATLAANFTVDGISYNITSTDRLTVEVTQSSPEYRGDIVIPEKVENGGNTYSVTRIRSHAFEGCSGLTSVTIPNSVTSIGDFAFKGCSGLTSVTIPNSVTSIGYQAFYGCSGLTSVTIPNSVTSIGEGAFSRCSGLTSVTIPNSVTSIGYRAFEGCYGLTSVTIPNSVTSIGEGAFASCSGLTSVTIPNSVTSIGEGAFYGCSGLTSVTIPNSVTSIGSHAFSGCSGLTSVKIESGNNFYVSVDGVVFTKDMSTIVCYPAGKKNSSYNIPNSVTSIGNEAFSGCSGLTSVTIPNSVTSIGNQAFEGCSGLTSVTIPNSVTSIGGFAFWDCRGLTSVTIPNSVTSIGNYAFSGCSGLTSVTIPNSVTSIGGFAFDGCSGLTSVTIPNSVTSIEVYTFSGCSGLTSVTIPNSVTSIGGDAFSGCSGLLKVIVEDIAAWCNISFGDYNANPLFYAHHLYSDENTEIKNLIIPNSVTSIGNWAFHNCSALTSVTIPNSVTSIGDYAFQTCSGLTSVTIPNSVTSIGDYAFRGCSGLTSIKVESGNTQYDSRNNCNAIIEINTNTLIAGCKNTVIPNSVTSIGNSAFHNCSGLTSVTIPNSVTSIGNYAFSGCSGLTSVTIPNSVTSIGSSAFYGCSGLTEVISLIEEPFKTDEYAFWGITNATLYVPVGTKEMYEATAAWNKFANIEERGIAPEDNGDVNYGGNGEIGGGTDLSGTVVGNVFYSIADGNGSYSSTEGCIVVKKPTTDEQVSQMEGTDLFGEQMKDNFTGIIFKIEPGSGTVKVTAETTGDMTLKIKIGDGAPMEFKLNGKLEAKLPYTVDVPTYVYIYAGSAEASGAKGARKAAGNGELKIYGISWGDGSTDGIGIIDNGQLTIDNSPIYNLNGQRVESLQKGINIVNGKKVLVQ